jgi:hypothetical protein
MRTRLVRPEFWADEKMAGLQPATRLFYIGLWALADDAGYFDWTVRGIAAELYRYEAPAQRERKVRGYLETLAKVGRIRLLPCNTHGLVPTLPDHRIKGGEQLFTIKRRHDAKCDGIEPVTPTTEPAKAAWAQLGRQFGGRKRQANA